LLKNPEFVIPNGVCEVRNLSFLGILIEEGFIAQKTCDAKSYLASLGMTAIRIFQQPAKYRGPSCHSKGPALRGSRGICFCFNAKEKADSSLRSE
jgi:hypothetical protein